MGEDEVSEQNIVLYHGNCFDGFCAAWVARQALPADTLFIPISYGDKVPKCIDFNSRVYILDFSFPKDVLLDIAGRTKFLWVLDHHKTAQANCEGLLFCTFDMERSGAGLTWDYFNGGKERPRLVNYMEDRDLWRFNLARSKEVFAYVASFPMDFGEWDYLAQQLEISKGRTEAFNEGGAILRAHNQEVATVCKDAWMKEVGGYNVPVVNCPYHLGSDVGHRLLELYPEAPFAAYFLLKGNGDTQWGLRGRSSDDFDVSIVAATMGGGGHKKASGFIENRRTRC
jgi:hypothetical protein